MFASVIEETLNLVPALAKLSLCSRRKQAPISPTKKRATGNTAVKRASKPIYDSDDAGKSTDVGTSDGKSVAGSTDVSDEESPTMEPQVPLMMPPPGLCLPPGLDAPPGLVAPWSGKHKLELASQLNYSTRLNSQAAIFVPSFATAAPQADLGQNNSTQLRQSIRHLKDALQEWEKDSFPATPLVQAPIAIAEENAMLALQEALGKLTPHDAATVRTFLDQKEAGQSAAMQATTGWNAMNRGNYQCTQQAPPGLFCSQPASKVAHPWTRTKTPIAPAQRPFTPLASSCVPKAVSADDDGDTLRTHLRDLAAMDNARVIMVRKINRLGLDSAIALQSHFAKIGTIERVMVSHSRSKSTFGQTRIRPATMGFLVMNTVEEAQAVLAQGEVQLVQGTPIQLSIFQSHDI